MKQHVTSDEASLPLTVPALVAASAARHDEIEALVDDASRLTYAELAPAVRRAAAAAMAVGIERGDRVAIWAPNISEWVVGALGVLSAGGVLVPLNTRFKGPEAAYVIAKIGARVVLTVSDFLGVDYVDRLRQATDPSTLDAIVVMRGDAPDGTLVWAHGDTRVTVTAPGASLYPAAGAIVWPVELEQGGHVSLEWEVRIDDAGAAVTGPPPAPTWEHPDVRADDRRLNRLVSRCLDDLHGLRMATPEAPEDVFLAAGAPWFFTLFGRDSIWAARMLLPLGTSLARGTLRTLARLQGTAARSILSASRAQSSPRTPAQQRNPAALSSNTPSRAGSFCKKTSWTISSSS